MHKTYVDDVPEVALFEVVQDRGFVKVGERGHILALIELGRVHLLQQVFFDRSLNRQTGYIGIGEDAALHYILHNGALAIVL